MSTVDQVFSDSIARLQGWLQFLERKAAEYQTQMNRVRRGPQPTSALNSEPLTSAPVADTDIDEAAPPDAENKQEDPWL